MPNAPKYRTIAVVTGEAGAGTTRFSLTGPGPHLYQSLDRGLEGTLEDVERAGLLSPGFEEIEYDWSPRDDGSFDQALAIGIRDQFEADLKDRLDAGYRMVTWDKEDQIWKMYRYAEFGAETAGQPRDFAKLDQRYIKQINLVKKYNASLVMIQSMRTPWEKVNGKLTRTTRREPKGFQELDRLAMVEINMRREPGAEGGPPEYFFDIGKSRQNSALQDSTFPAMTFSEFGTLLMPGSTESDWK